MKRRKLLLWAGSTASTACTGSEASGGGAGDGACAAASPNAGQPYCLASSQTVRLAGAASLALHDAIVFNVDDDNAVIVARDAGGWFARSAICTHACCIVSVCGDSACLDPGDPTPTPCAKSPVNAGGTALCPCHGSVFRLSDAQPLNGPATRPLPAYAVAFDGPDVVVDTGVIVAASSRIQA